MQSLLLCLIALISKVTEDRMVLDMLGVRGIECPSDLEILREALQTDEGKALMEKFKSMLEPPPK